MDGDWPHKLRAVQEAIHWAARGGATVVYRDAAAASSARQSRRPWIEIAIDAISMVGQDSVARVDDGAGGQTEVYTGQREFSVDVRAFSREQAPGQQAWYLADLVRTRLRRSKYARERWLLPNDIAIVDMREVANLSPRVWDGRAEGEASLELRLATSVCELDVANATTWIETVLLSSTGLPIELVDAEIPEPYDPDAGEMIWAGVTTIGLEIGQNRRQGYDASGGTFTLQAPSGPVQGNQFGVLEAAGDPNGITIDGNGADIWDPYEFEFVASFELAAAHVSLHWVFDGARWVLV